MAERPAPADRGRAEANVFTVFANLPEAARPWVVSLSFLTAICVVSTANTLWKQVSHNLTQPRGEVVRAHNFAPAPNLPLHVIKIRDEILMEGSRNAPTSSAETPAASEVATQITDGQANAVEAPFSDKMIKLAEEGFTKAMDRVLFCNAEENGTCALTDEAESGAPLDPKTINDIRKMHGTDKSTFVALWPKKPVGAAVSQLEFIAAFIITLEAESGNRQFDKNGKTIVSSAGAIGSAQVMPKTAKSAAKQAGMVFDMNRLMTDKGYCDKLGITYYHKMFERYSGDLRKTYAAYNAGPGKLDRAIIAAKSKGTPEVWLVHLPPETRKYVNENMRKFHRLREAGLLLNRGSIKDFATFNNHLLRLQGG